MTSRSPVLYRSGEARTGSERIISALLYCKDGELGDPMRRLGLRLLSDPSLRPSVRETISRVCGLHDDEAASRFLPASSVCRLAGRVNLARSTLRHYWREDAPLRCRLKEFMNWAVLLWAVRARARSGWDAIAEQMGLRRRTLEINFSRMAGCTLAAAAEDPERVVWRFSQWVDSVCDLHSAIGSGSHDPVPAPVGASEPSPD